MSVQILVMGVSVLVLLLPRISNDTNHVQKFAINSIQPVNIDVVDLAIRERTTANVENDENLDVSTLDARESAESTALHTLNFATGRANTKGNATCHAAHHATDYLAILDVLPVLIVVTNVC